MPASILSVFTWAWAIAFTCSGLAIITRFTNGDSTRDTAMQLPVASITTSSVGQRLLAEALQRRSRHVDPAGMPQPAVLPDHHLAKGSVDIHPDHASHPCLLSIQIRRERRATRQLRIRALGATGRVAEAASY